MLRSRGGGALAELQLNCPAQQQRSAAPKALGRASDRETGSAKRERQRRPELRTPHKTHRLPAETRTDTERHIPVVCTDPERTHRGTGIGTKIPTRATAPQPLLVGQREAETGRESHPLPSYRTEHSSPQTVRAGVADRDGDSGRASEREMMGELKARIQRSQAALAQLTEDTGQWLRDRDTDRQRQTQRETGQWLRDVPGGNKTERQRGTERDTQTQRETQRGTERDTERGGESVYERLIRADAQLQMLAGLEQRGTHRHRETHKETHRDTQRRPVVVAPRTSSDE